MTTVSIAPNPILQFFNNNGAPNAGGSVLTQVGGVNYPTYQDSAGTIPLPNPIPLNSRGEISNASGVSCQLFLVSGMTYFFTLYDVNGNQLNQATYVNSSSSATNIPYGTAADISDVYTVTIASGIVYSLATADGCIISVTIPTANTTITPHLNATLGPLVFSPRVIFVWRNGVAVAPIIGEIQGRCLFQWDNANTRWILLNSDTANIAINVTNALGQNQTLTDVSSTRVSGNTYTNSTGLPIYIIYTVSVAGGTTTYLEDTTVGLTLDFFSQSGTLSTNYTLKGIILSGHSYLFSGSLSTAYEIR